MGQTNQKDMYTFLFSLSLPFLQFFKRAFGMYNKTCDLRVSSLSDQRNMFTKVMMKLSALCEPVLPCQ